MRIKLLYFVPDISTSGGVERIVTGLTAYLCKFNEFDITILSCVHSRADFFYSIDHKVNLMCLRRPAYPQSAFAKIKWYLGLIRPLNAVIESDHFDIVFAEGTYLSLCLSLIKNKKVTKVGCEHIAYGDTTVIHKVLRRRFFKKLDALVVLTKSDQQYYSNLLSNVYNIPNFFTQSLAGFSDQNLQVVVACGRLEDQKGFDLLISSFVSVNKRHPDWHLLIFGEGSKKAELNSLISKLELNKVIELCGETHDIFKHLAESSIFVLPSRFEGFPLVLLEAMTARLACVSFDISGSNEIIKNSINGLLVERNNIEGLSKAILYFIEHKDQRIAIADRAKSDVSRYTLESIGPMWKDLILGLYQHKVGNP